MKKKLSLFLLPALLLLGACSKFDSLFADDQGPPLKGARISVLQLQKDLTPSADAQQTPVTLPEAWNNKFWPQTGGYPNHALGHLTLGVSLKKAWSASIGSGGDRRDPLISQPVAADGMVFTIDTEGEVSAFTLDKGTRKWHVSTIGKDDEDTGAIGGGLAYQNGRLYVTNGYKYLTCLDATNGKAVWRVALAAPARSAPTVTPDKVYIITLDNRLLVFAAADGAASWNYAGLSETTNLLGSVSPAVDSAVAVLPQSSGEIIGLRLENGQPVWQDSLSGVKSNSPLSTIADIRGQPVIDNGLVYAVSYSGRIVALDEVSGQRVWQKDIGSAEMPWSAGANIFLVTPEQQLTALTRDKGDVRWVTQLPRYQGDDKEKPLVWTGPVLAGGRLLTAGSGGAMIEADPQSGKILRQWDLPGNITLAPIVVDNTLLVLTEKGELVAYR